MARMLAIIALVALSVALSLVTPRSPVASEIQATAPSPGSLDLTFGTGGKVITDFEGDSYDVGWGVVIQRDAKIVVAGETQSSTNRSFAIVRYTSNGTLDPTFDGDGKVRTDFTPTSGEEASAVSLQADGKLLAAGPVWFGLGTRSDFGLVRYNADGSLDTTFDGDGKVSIDFGTNWDWPVGIAVQSDGKIVLAGFTEASLYGPKDVVLARYNRDGMLDGSFDGDGKIVVDVTGGGDDEVGSLAVQADGRVLVGGSTRRGSGYSVFLLRYMPDGSLDASFDGDGKLIIDNPTFGIRDLALQPAGKILAGGGTSFGVTRFNSNGSLDTSFGSGGTADARFTTSAGVTAIVVQPNGSIVVAGSVGYNFALARFRPNGALDTSFGSDGTVETDVAPGDDIGWDVGVAPDGKIVLAGGSRPTFDGPMDFAVARYVGDPQCRVPNVRGKKLALARPAISKAHCSVGTVKRKTSKKVKRGRVISQSPRAASILPNLGKVNLVVSKGRRR